MQVYFYLSLVLAGVLGVVALAAPLALCLFWRSLAAEVGWQTCWVWWPWLLLLLSASSGAHLLQR
jgi:hypothetical protein